MAEDFSLGFPFCINTMQNVCDESKIIEEMQTPKEMTGLIITKYPFITNS